MKNLLSKVALFAATLCVTVLGTTSRVMAEAPTLASGQDIIDAYRPDAADGPLPAAFGLLGDGTEYLWYSMIVFVVGWMIVRRFKRAGG